MTGAEFRGVDIDLLADYIGGARYLHMSGITPAISESARETVFAAAAIARGVGQMGPNREYLLNTVAHLRAMGVRDTGLDRIAALLPPG